MATTFQTKVFNKLEPVLDEWADYVTNLLREGMIEDKLKKSGRLFDSVRYEIVQAGGGDVAQLIIDFEGYGRIQAMEDRSVIFTKYPNLDKLKEYVRKYYFDKYGQGKRYQRVLELHGYDAAVQELTWALARTIRYGTLLKKPKKMQVKMFILIHIHFVMIWQIICLILQ